MVKNVVLKMAPHVLLESDDDETGAVLIDSRSGQLFACNDTASILARLLLTGASREALSDELAARFDVSHTRAFQDVSDFAEALSTAELLMSDGTVLDQVA